MGQRWGSPAAPTRGFSAPRISLSGPQSTNPPSHPLSCSGRLLVSRKNIPSRAWSSARRERRAKIPKAAEMLESAQSCALGRENGAQGWSQQPGSDLWGAAARDGQIGVARSGFGDTGNYPGGFCAAPSLARLLQGLRTGTRRGEGSVTNPAGFS